MLVNGEGPEEKAKGIALLTQGCDDKRGRACGLLAQLARKKTIPDPDGKFVAWAEKGCDLDDVIGCLELATVEEFGLYGVAKDAKKALETNKKACQAGGATGCLFAGNLERSGDAGKFPPEEIAKVYQQACHLGDNEGCARIGQSQ